MKFLHEEKAKTMTKKNSLGSIMSPHQLSVQLQDWYLASHRPLPWRADKNPYKIWISEVMLQQTTVQAVMPFYQRFLQRFIGIVSKVSIAARNFRKRLQLFVVGLFER
jgi:adenine-specific DNA glycosylase